MSTPPPHLNKPERGEGVLGGWCLPKPQGWGGGGGGGGDLLGVAGENELKLIQFELKLINFNSNLINFNSFCPGLNLPSPFNIPNTRRADFRGSAIYPPPCVWGGGGGGVALLCGWWDNVTISLLIK